MNSLLRLDLSNNSLGGSLGRGSFENLQALQAVNLANNNLTEVSTLIDIVFFFKNKVNTTGKWNN
jgi:hypothetical protein